MPTPPQLPVNQSLADFVRATAQQDRGHGVFELENPCLLELNLDGGSVWTKTGSMVAYRGTIEFAREGMLEQGVGNLLKKFVSGEGARLTKATGRGKVYVADDGKRVAILRLAGEALCVNGNDLLAFEPTLKYEVRMSRSLGAAMAGGAFNVRLEGTGTLAITTHQQPITLRVTPDEPLVTDPNATVAWSGSLEPKLSLAGNKFKALIGRGSGETVQSIWQGDGFVVVQPYEEKHPTAKAAD